MIKNMPILFPPNWSDQDYRDCIITIVVEEKHGYILIADAQCRCWVPKPCLVEPCPGMRLRCYGLGYYPRGIFINGRRVAYTPPITSCLIVDADMNNSSDTDLTIKFNPSNLSIEQLSLQELRCVYQTVKNYGHLTNKSTLDNLHDIFITASVATLNHYLLALAKESLSHHA